VSKENPYIFIGDSFFGLWNLPFSNVTNLGENASRIEQQRAYIEKSYPISHNGIVLNVGTNNLGMDNTIAFSLQSYTDLIDYLKTISNVIYCVSVIPIHKAKYFALHGATGHYLYNTPQRISDLNSGIQSICSAKGTHYVDIITSLSSNNEMLTAYTDDGIHPNTAGYALFADILRTNISDL
jgi:lysophospholipase L1-like esterase